MSSNGEGRLRRRARHRAKRFIRAAVAEQFADLLAEHTVEEAELLPESISARHVPLPYEEPVGNAALRYWTIPMVEQQGFDPSVVPPEDLWRAGDGFIESGEQHVEAMKAVLGRHGLDLRDAGGILDFGAGVGRMTRWLVDLADDQEVWGVDIEVAAVRWAQQHLSPPLLFSTCTSAPHLPFDDGTFGLIYAGSVFTHIEDLADAWLLELRRITRPGGYLYLTIHDQTTISTYLEEQPDYWMSKMMATRPDLFQRLGSAHAVIGDRLSTNVWYDLDYLTRFWGQWLEVVEVVPMGWFNQTVMVLRRRID